MCCFYIYYSKNIVCILYIHDIQISIDIIPLPLNAYTLLVYYIYFHSKILIANLTFNVDTHSHAGPS